MKKSVFVPLLVAVIAAVIYMWILSSNQSRFQEDTKLEKIIISNRDLPERKVLSKGDLTYVEIPKKYMQKDAYVRMTDSDITRLENNLVTKIAISKGNQIVKSALTSLSPEAGLSARVTPDWRGFVLTDVPTSVANLIHPDDMVDVLLTFEAVMKNTGQKERVTATLLQKIKVLGVGNDLGQGLDAGLLKDNKEKSASASAFNDSSAVSLALVPKDAQYLALAREEGTITLVVRRRDDNKVYVIPIASLTEMFK
jgi:pilus assembly protein CpaB